MKYAIFVNECAYFSNKTSIDILFIKVFVSLLKLSARQGKHWYAFITSLV